jgi:hypothetical protein
MWQLWSGFFWSLKFLTGEWRLMASGCFKPLQLGDWSTLSNYLSSWFFLSSLLLYSLSSFFWISIWKTWNLENGEAIGLQGEGPCTRSSTDCPCVQHVRGRATRLTWTRQSNSTFHGLLGMCPCNESHVNDMSDSVRHALFPAQASLTLKWVCAPEVSVGIARCNIPRQGPAKAICIEHVGTMKIQY